MQVLRVLWGSPSSSAQSNISMQEEDTDVDIWEGRSCFVYATINQLGLILKDAAATAPEDDDVMVEVKYYVPKPWKIIKISSNPYQKM
jgi:hypothetical protein